MKSTQTIILAVMAVTATWSGYGQDARAHTGRDEGSRTNTWKVQVGWVHQWGRGMTVRRSSSSGYSSGLSSLSDVPRLSTSGRYDDGYVLADRWTGDSGVPTERQNMTWNWGAENASQYDYDGGVHPTLTFHKNQGSYVGESYFVSRGDSDDDYSSDGIEVKASSLLYSWTSSRGPTNAPIVDVLLDVRLVFGLALFPGSSQKYRTTTGQDVYSVSETYTYLDYYGTAAGGSWDPLVVPYSGSYGTGTDPTAGPLIPVTPESSSQSSSYSGTYQDSVAIKSKLWHLRGALGVEFVKPLTERLDVYVSPQVVLEFIDMHAERSETVTFTDRASGSSSTVTSASDSKSKMTLIPGILLTAGADYRLSERWFAGASVGWEWLAEEPSLRVGGDRVEYDLGGGEFSLYVGCRF